MNIRYAGLIAISLLVISVIPAHADVLPSWVKNLASFYANGQINDTEFEGAIQYLIDQKIVKTNNTASELVFMESNATQLIFADSNATQISTESTMKNLTQTVNSLQAPVQSPMPDTGISLTLNLDKASYSMGDKIKVSGVATPVDVNQLVTIMIQDPNGNIVNTNQVTQDDGGNYNETVSAEGILWKSTGTYTVTVQAGLADSKKTTTFTLS